jgi:hypothetical protein
MAAQQLRRTAESPYVSSGNYIKRLRFARKPVQEVGGAPEATRTRFAGTIDIKLSVRHH